MTKAELATLIMANTGQYKKTHLAKMHLADLETLAAPYMEATPASEDTASMGVETLAHAATPIGAETLPQAPAAPHIADAVAEVYDENAKMVRGPRLDKEEFRKVVIEKAVAQLLPGAAPATVRKVTLATMEELLQNKTAFCPINDTERLMLETIPLLDDFESIESVIDGKGFLAKVKEVHGIENSTTRALMVSLCRKGFYRIIGVKSGQKKTTIVLQERGIRYLEALSIPA